MTPQRLHAGLSGVAMSKAYLIGALHDATERTHTYRISQKEKDYVLFVKDMIIEMGCKAWVYREGKTKNVYVVEFSKSVLDGFNVETDQEKIDYIKGYFDAEGSVPKKDGARMYIYFAQKNKEDLEGVQSYLEELGVICGKTHNPRKTRNTGVFSSAAGHTSALLNSSGQTTRGKKQYLRW